MYSMDPAPVPVPYYSCTVRLCSAIALPYYGRSIDLASMIVAVPYGTGTHTGTSTVPVQHTVRYEYLLMTVQTGAAAACCAVE